MKNHFSLALKNLKHRGIRSWLTILGIFIGIAAVVSLITLGGALRTTITGQFGTLDPDKLTIQNSGTGFGPPGSTAIRKLTSNDIDLIKSVNGVDKVIPRLIRIVKIEYNKILQFNYIGSLTESDEQNLILYNALNTKLMDGKLLAKEDNGKVLLGYDFAGDNFGKPIKVGTKVKIQDKEFEVIGIMAKSSSFINNGLVIMTEKDMKEILNIGDEVDMIIVQVKDRDQVEQVKADIEKTLRKDRKEKIGEEDFSVQTSLQTLETVNSILTVINAIILAIASISLLVGGIGIANTMYTSVLERTREIGIMTAIGAKNSDILKIFLIESSLLGLVGGIIGIALGLGLGFLVSTIASYALIELPVTISYSLLFLALGFSLFIGTLSGIVPAIQASKLNPVEALRR